MEDELNEWQYQGGQLYSPSWIDRLTDWIGKFPGQPWYYFFAFGLTLIVIQAIILWIENGQVVGVFNPAQVFLSAAIVFILTLFHYLDEWAGSALDDLGPNLIASKEEIQKLRFKITTLPGGRTLLSNLGVLIFVLFVEWVQGSYIPVGIESGSISAVSTRVVYLICWMLFGGFIFHTVHQLRIINKIYIEYTNVQIFRMKPFYAFSNLSAFTAGCLTVLPYGFLIVNPGEWKSEMISILIIVVITILAIITFILPQLGMHRLQEKEQERLIDQAYLRLEASISELHYRLDEKNYNEMEELNLAINSLEIELNALKGIRTWPWEPETLQILVTALALPFGLWLIQFIVERFLGG